MIFGEEKKFRQRLAATAEGPFSTVRLITRPARRQQANRVHTLVLQTPPLSGFLVAY